MNGKASLALFVLAASALAQTEVAPTETAGTPAELIARYQQLDPQKRAAVVRNMERRLQRENNESLQRIQTSQLGKAAYVVTSPPRWFDPREYAPSATPRHLVTAGTDEHRAATVGMRRFECLPDLHAGVFYDWQSGKAVRREQDLTDDERFANFANGFAPGADHAVAQALQALDTEPGQRLLGNYFDHLYGDRYGQVFAGVSIYDAWNSGKQIEMPDTDAIAFARLALHTQSFRAPLPDNRRRDRLYEKMLEAFASHREHRTLRLAVAATLVAAEPRLEPSYQALIDRGHWLWQKHGLDQKRLAEFVAKAPDRSALLQLVDTAMSNERDLVTVRRQALLALAAFLRQLADDELRNANG